MKTFFQISFLEKQNNLVTTIDTINSEPLQIQINGTYNIMFVDMG